MPLTLNADGRITSPLLNVDSDGDVSGVRNIQNTGQVGSSSTSHLALPSGTTAQRPGSPANGYIRYNTDENYIEEYRGGAWNILSNLFIAEGGTEVTSGGYKYHTFTSSGDFTVTSGNATVEYLIVAGGGGGGNHAGGGGGGAGGMLTGSVTASIQTYSIVIGAGGAKVGTASTEVTNDGNDSTVFGLTAIGGGRSSYQTGGDDGGSAGGGMGNGGQGTGGSGTSGQGNDGGDAASQLGGGGGGKGAAGANGSSPNAGAGGVGSNSLSTWATATSTGDSGYYAGGGGGGAHVSGGIGGSGGSGGGGDGASYGTTDGSNGSANTGGGGGGAGGRGGINPSAGGAGGSGIVIIRYAV